MTPENYRAHAHLARLLIRECGGLTESAKACRLEKSRLQEFTNPLNKALMPLDVIEELQDHCGRLIYYEGIAAALPGQDGAIELRDESCALSESVLSLQGLVRHALLSGHLSHRQKHEVCALVHEAEQHLRLLKRAAEASGS